MTDKVNEILDILQEECAELIQAISKCRRFGMDNEYRKGTGTQRDNLIQEIGDVAMMLELLWAHKLYTQEELHQAKLNKATKLQKWSNIYED